MNVSMMRPALASMCTSFVFAGCAAGGNAGPQAPLCIEAGAPASATLLQVFRGTLAGGAHSSLIAPEQLAVSANDMWIADRGRGELVRVDRTMQRSVVMARASGRVAGLHVDRLRSVYLALPAQRVVRQLGFDGRLEREYRNIEGRMIPVDVVTDGTGPVFVADGANARVVIFNRLGQVTGTLGELVSRPSPFLSVNALAQEAGRLYVLDASARKVHVVREDGAMETLDLAGTVNLPVALAVDRWHRIFVGDSGGRVAMFEADATRAPSSIEGLPRIAQLGDLWIDETGVLYLADTAGGAVYSLQVTAPCP